MPLMTTRTSDTALRVRTPSCAIGRRGTVASNSCECALLIAVRVVVATSCARPPVHYDSKCTKTKRMNKNTLAWI